MLNKISISKLLIIVSFIVTILAYFFPYIYVFGLNRFFLEEWLFFVYIFQLVFSVFLHWGILHFFMNSIFLYYFWSVLEILIWRKKFVIFFIFTIIFEGLLITLVEPYVNTIWISGFCMALLTYFTLELKSRNNPEYKWWITALVVNILVWFLPGISLWGHLFGAIAWALYYLINKDLFRPKMVWKVVSEKWF